MEGPRFVENTRGPERSGKPKTLSRDIIRRAEGENGEILATHECNGRIHRRVVEEIFYDDAGVITFVTEHERIETGPCDCN